MISHKKERIFNPISYDILIPAVILAIIVLLGLWAAQDPGIYPMSIFKLRSNSFYKPKSDWLIRLLTDWQLAFLNPYQPVSTQNNPNQPISTQINPNQPKSILNQPESTRINQNQPESALHHTQVPACC